VSFLHDVGGCRCRCRCRRKCDVAVGGIHVQCVHMPEMSLTQLMEHPLDGSC
jgi:hypothetical protein